MLNFLQWTWFSKDLFSDRKIIPASTICLITNFTSLDQWMCTPGWTFWNISLKKNNFFFSSRICNPTLVKIQNKFVYHCSRILCNLCVLRGTNRPRMELKPCPAGTCRTCGQSAPEPRSIFGFFEGRIIATIITECTAVQVRVYLGFVGLLPEFDFFLDFRRWRASTANMRWLF